jgi:hypothetical protein
MKSSAGKPLRALLQRLFGDRPDRPVAWRHGYFVAEGGETLRAVACANAAKPDLIAKANGLRPESVLKPGQLVWVDRVYACQADETPAAVARCHGCAAGDILELNAQAHWKADSPLAAGTVVRIPPSSR